MRAPHRPGRSRSPLLAGPMRARTAAAVAAIAAVAGACRDRAPREERPPAEPPPPPCPIAAPGPFTGEATRYAGDGTGACSFDATPDRRVAAIGGVDYAGGAWCGACAEVTGPDGRVTVRIVDRCPACKPGDLDLSREAFAAIAAPEAGRVRISWRPVPCEIDGPLEYRVKDGSNPHWAALQVRRHRYPIASLELRGADGAWRKLPRTGYNYFVAAGGLGDGPLALRVTDARGRTVEESGLPSPFARGSAATDGGSGSGGGAAGSAALSIAGTARLPRCPGD